MKYLFKIEDFKYADLSKCEYFYFKNRIYFTSNTIHPQVSEEVWWSLVLRTLKLKKYITYGKPININCKENINIK